MPTCPETQIVSPTRFACEKCNPSYSGRVSLGLMSTRFTAKTSPASSRQLVV